MLLGDRGRNEDHFALLVTQQEFHKLSMMLNRFAVFGPPGCTHEEPCGCGIISEPEPEPEPIEVGQVWQAYGEGIVVVVQDIDVTGRVISKRARTGAGYISYPVSEFLRRFERLPHCREEAPDA